MREWKTFPIIIFIPCFQTNLPFEYQIRYKKRPPYSFFFSPFPSTMNSNKLAIPATRFFFFFFDGNSYT
uniref:Uncharacterized protein n=1 Tax=Rhizophora mucronata TaxID=61149 RepID=A0A2P2NZ96_RHIMU